MFRLATYGLATLFCLGMAIPALAQQQRGILWLVDVEAGATVEADVVRDLFSELLQGADDAEHMVDVAGLAEHIGRHGIPIPGCLNGIEACPNAVTAIAQQLRLDVIASVRVSGDGSDLILTVRGIDGGAGRTLQFHGDNIRDAAFQVVNEFVGASAHLAVASHPSGARVLLDGEELGVTPYQGEVAVGIYALTLDLAGYAPHTETVELRPNDSRLVDRNLDRMYAELVVETITPGARLRIDGEELGDANRPIRLPPGPHEVALDAPGYVTEVRTVDLDAGLDRRFRFDLRESAETIRRREMGYIYERPFFVEGGFRFAGTGSGFGEATGELGSHGFTVLCPRTSTGDCAADTLPVNLVGLEGQVGVSFRTFELMLLGVSYSLAQVGGASGDGRTLTLLPDDPVAAERDELAARVTSVSRFQLEPAHVGARHLFNASWSIFGHAGVGWYTESFDVEGPGLTGSFSRNGWVWNVDVGGRFHMNDTVYVAGAFELGGDLTYDDVDLTKGFSISIGMTWEDFIGVTDWFGGDDEPPDDLAWGEEVRP